jgi:prolyl 4-hydroxylase
MFKYLLILPSKSLFYRSDVEEGGETVFPAANMNFSSVPWYNELSECGKKGLSVKPRMGDALLFWSMRPDATLDPTSLHGKLPSVLKVIRNTLVIFFRYH